MAGFADVRKKVPSVKKFQLAVFAAALIPLTAVQANTSEGFRAIVSAQPAPTVLDNSEKQTFIAIYQAIKAQKWDEAEKLIDKAPQGPMAAMARAEYYLAPNSPKVDAERLQALLQSAPYLPQAEQLAAMAKKRGADALPDRPGIRRFSWLGGAPKRDLPANAANDGLRSELQVFIKNDDPASAERLLESKAFELSTDAVTELRYRVAWSYYIENDDQSARRVAALARAAGGDWGTQASWVYGLASWRLKDYPAAFEAFDTVARFASNDDLKAAGLFWSARAAMSAKQPQQVQPRMQHAAKLPETFYGLLASESLGMEPIAKKAAKISKLDWNALKDQENAVLAVALTEVGQTKLADEALRHQAKIGDARQHANLAQLAGSLNLASTQFWMGHYGPSRDQSNAMARYPMPNWEPTGGWRVTPALVYAHALQESTFRTDVISPAGARGLMQVRPGTAQDIARARGASFVASELDRPSVNLEYGQSYLEKLRDMPSTGGLLPKVIAAYNAGPTPLSRWNMEIRDNGDPLLFVESIPYWETRGYVSTILRNYWIYEMRENKASGSLKGLAQYLWPNFPDGNGNVLARRMTGGSIAAR
ncbi:lytic transglycosylase domain-containing protein [Sphingorhabdus contaminans]|uniref:Lytic transglycosylase domain-containing protein n=1 Tax=Sphingorhabdus contaminans TaxID=1343899 RepID=A0A553WIY9_9SPHN|nr:lytic transglycosylase domain-containing protein [Sphingorhabdus contaminans]TSB04646.1 lytic transglycosylase domain-containing protein [Sphingorhabdus contaminans]